MSFMKKAYLHTFGCKVNQYETQLFRETLTRDGYVFSDNANDADIIFVNTCTVTGEADRQCRQLLRRLLKKNATARILVSGCYAVRDKEELRRISDRIEIVTARKSDDASSAAISEFSGHSRAFIKIQDGCDAFCSYCIVPHVRPVLWSRPVPEIVAEISSLAAKGYAEMVLSGIRLGKYVGGLPALLRTLLVLPGNFRLRLSSLEINEAGDDLVELMASEPDRICAHLHVPLQSGSDTVLKRMNRPYSSAQFAARLDRIRAVLPAAGISTDVIVGFPGETDLEFDATRGFIEENSFSRLHVFAFSPRSGTPAAGMPERPSPHTVSERSLVLRDIDARLQEKFWRRWIGTCRPAVREGSGQTLLTDNYIRLETDADSSGISPSIMTVKIIEKNGKPWAIKTL